MLPMLATKGTHVPTDAGWSHEVKWDGVRVLADTTKGGTTRLLSRNENPVTVAWPELNRSPLGDRDLLVDGEVIALNERGLPDFRVLQDRMHVRNAAAAARLAGDLPATYMVFDVMRVDGRDLTATAAGGAAHDPARPRPGALDLAGAGGLRRRPDAVRGDAAAGAGGHRQQAADLALRVRRAVQELAEVRPPAPPLVRRRRLAAPGGHQRPARCAARRRADAPRGCSTGAGSAAGSVAPPAGHSPSWSRRWAGATARSPTRCRGSTRPGRSGSSRCWSWTSRPTAWATRGCGSRRTAASASDLSAADLADQS